MQSLFKEGGKARPPPRRRLGLPRRSPPHHGLNSGRLGRPGANRTPRRPARSACGWRRLAAAIGPTTTATTRSERRRRPRRPLTLTVCPRPARALRRPCRSAVPCSPPCRAPASRGPLRRPGRAVRREECRDVPFDVGRGRRLRHAVRPARAPPLDQPACSLPRLGALLRTPERPLRSAGARQLGEACAGLPPAAPKATGPPTPPVVGQARRGARATSTRSRCSPRPSAHRPCRWAARWASGASSSTRTPPAGSNLAAQSRESRGSGPRRRLPHAPRAARATRRERPAPRRRAAASGADGGGRRARQGHRLRDSHGPTPTGVDTGRRGCTSPPRSTSRTSTKAA